MTSKYSVIDLAARVCNFFDKPIERLKLEKLCYYAQAWYYSLYKQRLLEEDFFAMPTGPRLMPLWDEPFGDASILLQNYGEDGHNIWINPNYDRSRLAFDNGIEDKIIEAVCSWYGPYDGNRLSTLSHSEPPWQKARVVAAKSKMVVPISLQDMKGYYTKGHHFYPLICPVLETYKFSKLVVVKSNGKSLSVKGLSKQDERVYAEMFSTAAPSTGLNESVDTSGNAFEYYRADSNILIISPEAKEYMKEYIVKMLDVSKLKNLVQKGIVNHSWDSCIDETGGKRYLYVSPELGIMVNEKTRDDAIGDAVENLKHQYNFYINSSCSPQDEEEKELVFLAYSVYESSPSDFYTLLGLATTRHQQGEVLNAGNLA